MLPRSSLKAPVLLLVCLACSTLMASAQNLQDSTSQSRRWFTLSLGRGSPYDMSQGFSLSIERRWIYQVGINDNRNLIVFGPGPALRVTSLDFTLGQALELPGLPIAGHLGPALVFGRHERDKPLAGPSNFVTPGVTAKASFFLGSLSTFGLGIEVYGNLNLQQNAFGVRGSLLIGGF